MAQQPPVESSHTHPSPELREQGKRFGEWLSAAQKRVGWRNKDTAAAASLSNTYVGVLIRGGVNSAGIYQRPSEEVIHRLAVALGADEDAGLLAAGYKPRAPRIPGQIVLQSGQTYTIIADPTGNAFEIEMTPEFLRELELHAELQQLRRKLTEVLD
jgi:transcriptional regulator with XRE-family HTH domain